MSASPTCCASSQSLGAYSIFQRKFRNVLSRGISKEIRRVHVERAKRLLAGTDLAVSAIADGAGFSNANHRLTTSLPAKVAQCQTKV
jgi:AraC-like DNA-binding protein